MSAANLTERELDNILVSYQNYGEAHLADYIRSIWKEAWEEGSDIGYKKGVADGYNMARAQLK